MKHSAIKLYCTAVLLFIFTNSQAQLVPPFNHRAQQATQLYGLSAQQLKDYEKVLNGILSQWDAVKESKCSPSARKDVELKLQNELCTEELNNGLPKSDYYESLINVNLWKFNEAINIINSKK